MERRFPFPLPDGWFQVAWADELAAGEVRPLRYFGRELVLFRTEAGRAALLDAHCPHLGAHLGRGGRVCGESLRCPFHAWRFDAEGRCVEIPYAKRIPPRARARAWPVAERNGQILAWRHAGGAAPSWAVPALPEYGAPHWTPYRYYRFRVRTRSQEIIENAVDRAHFRYVHDTVDVPEAEVRTEGPVLRALQRTRFRTPQGVARGAIESVYHGLGVGSVRFTGICEALLVLSFAPIDEESLDVRFAFTLDASGGADPDRGVGAAIIQDIVKQFEEDTPIWEHKIYRERPALCESDGPIGRYRRWARQFYSEAAGAADQRSQRRRSSSSGAPAR